MDVIAVGSSNPVKVDAVRQVFQQDDVAVIGMDVDSGVSAQPFSDEETKIGAVHRAWSCLQDDRVLAGVGLEGGVMEDESGGLLSVNWGALMDRAGRQVNVSGARYPLPEEIAAGLRYGKELGACIDAFSRRKDVRKQEGAVGILTNGFVTRQALYAHIMRLLAGQYAYMKQQH